MRKQWTGKEGNRYPRRSHHGATIHDLIPITVAITDIMRIQVWLWRRVERNSLTGGLYISTKPLALHRLHS